MTSKNITKASTSAIEMIWEAFFALMASANAWIAAKLPEIRINRNGQRIRLIANPESWEPVRSASTSVSVGRNVNVKIVASSADQNRMKTNAIQGTRG